MQAIVNTQYGAPDVLQLAETQRPALGSKDILVQVHASSVTQGDRRLRAADYPGISAVFGRLWSGVFRPRHRVGGTTFAGRVVAIGHEVTHFAVGDDVFGSAMRGAYAQWLAVPENSGVAHLPQGVEYGQAAAVPYGALTALVFLKYLAKVQPGQRVLVIGAAGGVGSMAVQVARHLGAHVTAVCGDGANWVRSLGASAVVDYRRQDFTQLSERWDVILDTTEGNHFQAYRRALAPDGRYLTLYASLRVLWEMVTSKFLGTQRAITGVALATPDLMAELADLVGRGAVRATIAERYPLAETALGHAALQSSTRRGTVVIDVMADARDRSERPELLACAE